MLSAARLQEALLALAASERRERALRTASEALLLGVEMLELASSPEELAAAVKQAFLRAVPAEEAWLLVRCGHAFAAEGMELPHGVLSRRVAEEGVLLLYDFQRTKEARRAHGFAHLRAALLVHLPAFAGERMLVLGCARPGVLAHAHALQARTLRRFALLAARRLARFAEEKSAAVHAELARLARLFDLVPAGVFVMDAQGNLVAANPEARRLLAASQERRAVWQALHRGEREFKLAQGERTLAFAVNEAEQGWVGVVRDLSRDARIEEQLRRTQRLASLARMAGGLAHNFNNQLMAVLGALEMLDEAVANHAEAKELVALAAAAARKMAEIAHGMLVFSGKLRTQLQALDLGAIVREVVDAKRAQWPRAIAWRVEEEARVQATADPVLLREAVGALLDNAAEALGEKGGEVRVRTGALELDAARLGAAAARSEAAEPGFYGFIEVADEGPGIPPEVRAHLFEPFVSARFFGRGLGLALVLGVVRTHAGAVEVESAPGQGTCVRILLPTSES